MSSVWWAGCELENYLVHALLVGVKYEVGR